MAREYPKMLYLGGEVRLESGRAVPHQNTRLVGDEAEEAEAREAGFSDAGQAVEDTLSGGGPLETEAVAPVSEGPKRKKKR
jgi:hypothetical protein